MQISKKDFATLFRVAVLVAAVVTVVLSLQCQKYDRGGKRVAQITPANLGQAQELKLALPQPAPATSVAPEENGPRFRAIDPLDRKESQLPLVIVPKNVFCSVPVRQQINPFITAAADGHATFDSLQFVPGVNVDGQLRSSMRVNMGAKEHHTMLNISLTNTVCGNVSQIYPFVTQHEDGHVQLDSIGFWPPTWINGSMSTIARFQYSK